jgi:hypothetical protein
MNRYSTFPLIGLLLGLAAACEQGSRVESETRELTEAQNNSGNVAKDLEAQLQTAKANVIELEKKLAMAREGVTDEVIQKRADLEDALKEQQQQVQQEVNEAKREAQTLNKDTDRAMQQLRQTQPPARVEAQVRTETQVVPGAQQQQETPGRTELIPVRGGPEEQRQDAAGGAANTTTRVRSTAPAQPSDRPSEAPPTITPDVERPESSPDQP